MNKLSSEHWSNYWEKGTVTTFYKKFDDNYDGEIEDHWNNEFAQLSQNSLTVDLATGNGALLSLLDKYALANHLSFKAVGVDFSILNQDIISKVINDSISIQENTKIEKIDLPDDSVDLAISQFGFEYADMEDAVTELDRILKPAAKINFIMHAHGSQIINDGFNSLKQIDLVNDKLKLNQIIRKIIPAIHGLRTTGKQKYKAKADRLRGKLNGSIEVMTQYAERIADPGYIDFYYEHALGLFKGEVSQNSSVDQKMQHMDWIEAETASMKLRMQDLTSVAMSEDDNVKIKELLRSVGFNDIEIKPFIYNNAHIGQTVTGTRD